MIFMTVADNELEDKNKILNANLKYLSNYTFDTEPLVSIIIPNRDGLKYLKILFNDFAYKANYSNFEIIFVDNASSDGSVEYVKSLDFNKITIIENDENLSFSKLNNDAVDVANGEYILFLNNDIEPTFGWLNEMMGTMLHNENIGAVGAKLIFPYNNDPMKEEYSFSIQHYGGILRENSCEEFDYAARHQYKFSKDIFDEKFLNNKKCIIATAAVFLIRKDTFLEMNGFDEDYLFGFEDVDLDLKLYKAGYDIVLASAALLFHYESVTRKKEKRQNYVVFNEKWGDYLFKELLYDKLEKNYFLTDKKLSFLFINKRRSDFRFHRYVKKAVKYLNSEKYDTHISDQFNLDINHRIDILVSTTLDYDIESISARKNIIKILVLRKGDFNPDKCQNYDIIISDDKINLSNAYLIKNLSKFGEELPSILYSHYFK